jgi:hypothetical protein
VSVRRPPIYGYMLAHEGRTSEQIMRDELALFRWAQAEDYHLALIYQEEDEGSIAALTELVEQLKLNGDRAVVVPSIRHFGSRPPLQDHLLAYVVHAAQAEVHEVSQR